MAKTTAITLTREDLILAVQQEMSLPSKAEAKRTLDGVLGCLANQLKDNANKPGFTLRLQELATFKVVAVAAREARNPTTGDKIKQAARNKVKVTLPPCIKALGKK